MDCHNNIEKQTLGLDIGALAVKAVLLGPSEKAVSLYRLHRGRPEQTIVEIVGELGSRISAAAITGSGGRKIADRLGIAYVDPAVALIAAAGIFPKARHIIDVGARHSNIGGHIRHIIDVGGASLSIADLDLEGRFAGFRTNSLCAAGTGSFLDEQAIRMNLSPAEMSRGRDIENPPRIAARCAVFAKSDLIHRQQEGFSIPEMWSGLCRGMVTTALSTLFRGRKPQGPVVVAGGVALNREVVRWLAHEIEAELVVPDDPSTFSARGAIRAARPAEGIDWNALLCAEAEKSVPRRPELKLARSAYPSFECRQSYVDDSTEVRIHKELAGDVVVGIDIGSTSTKAAIVDLDGNVVADLYRRTSGDPIGATQKILAAIGRAHGVKPLGVKALATTGSGRKMVGAIIGADRIVNEITAHVEGARATDPDVETIFEIGGQDAKFVALREGVAHDSNMNYVCAAGTGSFVEEQAGKLGFALHEIGDAVMGAEPPYSSDRCTVFMGEDVHALTRQGFERREIMGSVLYSVVQNYLNRVVGRRPWSRKKICFMGATARNRGLVAAFENILGEPISVSPYCHVMGAMGVARIALDEIAKKDIATTFRGLAFAEEKVELRREVCELCANNCRITRAAIGNETDESGGPSWGYMCGRDPLEPRARTKNTFDAFRKRDRLWRQYATEGRGTKDEGRKDKQTAVASLVPASNASGRPSSIGIPRALLTFGNLPMWSRFFKELGLSIALSKPTHDGTLAAAADFIGSDYCLPVKLAHGHVRELAADPAVDAIFLPYIIQSEPHDDGSLRSVFCPYNIALPSIIRESGVNDEFEKTILSAAINFQLGIDIIVDELKRGLAPTIDASEKRIERAWLAALDEQRSFETDCAAIGKDALAKLEAENGRGVVIFGRPYNVCDLGANLNLPRKIADLGLTVFTVDMLPLAGVPIDPLFHNMYWRYGRKILQAASLVATNPRLHAVFLTNFGCGPDSFLQTYVERIMKGKPMLMLELDEHSADAGYITRLEAFKDVIDKMRTPDAQVGGKDERRGRRDEKAVASIVQAPAGRDRPSSVGTLWIPPMHPYGTVLLAAALRSRGHNAQPLPTETVETFEIAKRFCRGTECVPAPSTIGAFLSVLKNSDDPRRERFFMPSAKGPCRFGQYHTLHRIILDEAGYKDVEIEAWSDESGSYGTDMKTSRRLYNAMLAADLLFKARCRVRPYAKDRAGFDALMESILARATAVIERGGDLKAMLRSAVDGLAAVEISRRKKPLVGIVGEIYVRLNPFTNGRLVETIEDAGGEAWVAPITEWFQYLAFLDRQKAKLERYRLSDRLKKTLKNSYMMRQERILMRCMLPVIGDRLEPSMESTLCAGERYFPLQFDGESILTVGRAVEFSHQGADLIINCAPFGCMPGTLTSGIFQRIEGKLGVPVVSLFFDGETNLKHLVRTYLANVRGEESNPKSK